MITQNDGSCISHYRFSILPPIDASDQLPDVPENRPEPQEPEPVRDPDYNDPSSYGWHITSVDKWPAGYEDGNSKDPKSDITNLGPVNSLKMPLKPTGPTSTTYGAGVIGKGPPLLKGSGLVASDAVSNSYVAMSVMTSGQEELKRHLKQRQQQRASDQKDFQAESVNGKPLNSTGTFLIKYGDVEVPTTDVELYAILSVEKHNSPFASEYTVPIPGVQGEANKAIPEKMAEKLDTLVEKDRIESKVLNQAVEKFFSTESEQEEQSEEAGSNEGPSGPKPRPDSSDLNLPMVHSGKQASRAGPPKLGHLIAVDPKPKRRGKQGQLYKCYDTTKPLAVKAKQQAESQPIILKPLVSTAVVEQHQQPLPQPQPQQQRQQQQPMPQQQPIQQQLQQQQKQKPHIVKITPIKRNSQQEIQAHPEEGPISIEKEGGSKSERRNISVTLPVMTCDEDDGSSQTTSQDGGYNTDDLPLATPSKGQSSMPTSRQPYYPPKVLLGSTRNARPLSEISSSASSRSSSSMNSVRSAKQRNVEEESKKENIPDEVDLEMNEKMLAVTGAGLSRRGSAVGGGNTNMNNSNNSRGRHGSGNSNAEEYARRAAPPRIGVPMRKGLNDDKHETSSVSMISVSSDPVDSRSSTALWRNSPVGENSVYASLSTHTLLSERLSMNSQASRTNSTTSLLASRRSGMLTNTTGSLPELRPAPAGLSVTPGTSKGHSFVSGKDLTSQRSQTVLPSFHGQGQVVPEIRMILPTPQPPRYSTDQRNNKGVAKSQKH